MAFNPLRGVENKRTVWAWGMFDLANQSFTLLINTLLFALFFREVVVADEALDDTLWSIAVASSLGIVVILSPVLGAIADLRGLKKEILMTLGVCCAVLTCGLALVPAGGGTKAIVIAMAIYIPANVAYQLGENFLASFLPEIATRENMGRVSGFGWSMGYLGALVLLGLTFAIMLIFNIADDKASWRGLFVFAGIWFLLMMVPTALFLHEKKSAERTELTRTIVGEAFHRLAVTLKQAKEFRHFARFLLAFLVFGFGVQVVIFFSTIIAGSFGFEGVRLVIFVGQITVVAGITAMFVSVYQDRVGHRKTVEIFLLIWAANAIGLALLAWLQASRGPDGQVAAWPIWLIGNGLGIGLGGIGTASRSIVGVFTPAHRTAEFFGLWGLTYKLAGCIGVLSFGVMRDALGPVWALGLLASFFIAGFLILLSVNEEEGMRAAIDAERAHAQSGAG